jgi:hypothetical protein
VVLGEVVAETASWFGGGAVVRLQVGTPHSWGAVASSPLFCPKLGGLPLQRRQRLAKHPSVVQARAGSRCRIATTAETPQAYRSARDGDPQRHMCDGQGTIRADGTGHSAKKTSSYRGVGE